MMPTPESFPTPRVKQVVLDHDKVMDDLRDRMQEAKAIYETEWWDHYIAQGMRSGAVAAGHKRDGAEIEVNHLHRMMRTYLSDLFPDASRVVCEPDPRDRGNSVVIQTALNDWWEKPYGYLTVDHATMMALILPGAGLKIGYDPGDAPPIERVWMRPIPPWELILDREAPSWEDERYRGHIYQAPIQDVVARYPQLEGKIKGGLRLDYFEQASVANGKTLTQSTATPGEYVRVLEFLNLTDCYVSATGERYKGRLEVYVLDQGEVSNQPVVTTPLPFTDADGRDLPNIEPLTLDHEVGYPLRPLAPAKVIIPQQTELNKLRTAMARDTRRNARKFMYQEGAIEQDGLDKLTSGVDGQGVSIKPDVPFERALKLVENQPISADNFRYMQLVEADLARVTGPSQNAQGQAIDTTKYEVEVIQAFAEALLKYHGKLLYGTLARVMRLVQSAIIAAAKDSGDSEGGLETAPPESADRVGHETYALGEDAEVSVEETTKPVAPKAMLRQPSVHPFKTFPLKSGGQKWEVTEADLTANCKITFVGSDSTPLNRATMAAFMTGPGFATYMQLWGLVQKGGAEGLLAERAMQHIAEAMNLPKDMQPGAMKAELKREQAAAPPATPPKKGGPPPGVGAAMGPPPMDVPAAEGELAQALADILTMMAQAAQGDPELARMLRQPANAIQTAVKAASSGDMETAARAVALASQSLPPGVLPDVEAALAALSGEPEAAPDVPTEAMAEPPIDEAQPAG